MKLKEVAHSFGHTMQPDMFLNRILIGFFFFFFFFLEGKCQNLILFNQNQEFGIVSKFNFPQEGKRSGLPLPSYKNCSPLTAIFS